MHPQRNWRDLIKPKALEVEEKNLQPTYGKFVAEPFERGFGTTVGNRVWTWDPVGGWLESNQTINGLSLPLVGSGGSFAVLGNGRAWAGISGGSEDLQTLTPVELIGSGGNFAVRVSNRVWTWRSGAPNWVQSGWSNSTLGLLLESTDLSLHLSAGLHLLAVDSSGAAIDLGADAVAGDDVSVELGVG